MSGELYDALIVGGGPAGLSAALYLARYDRSVALFDTGHGRSTWHQVNHNYLGFPGGISALELRERGKQQVASYEQVTFFDHKITELQHTETVFTACGQAGSWTGRTVIFCTGTIDHFPHFPDWDQYVGRSMFWCLTCDGFGCKGARVIMLGNSNAAAAEALQLRRFTDKISVLTNSRTCNIDESHLQRLRHAQIPCIEDSIEAVKGHDGQFEAIVTTSGLELPLDQLFSLHGATAQTELAESIGVELHEGYIKIDNEQKTSVAGAFAAGDVTCAHGHQVSAAVHEGAQAASAANAFLYPAEISD